MVLRACSLVSREWRVVVTPYLFRKIIITDDAHTVSEYVEFFLVHRLQHPVNVAGGLYLDNSLGAPSG